MCSILDEWFCWLLEFKKGSFMADMQIYFIKHQGKVSNPRIVAYAMCSWSGLSQPNWLHYDVEKSFLYVLQTNVVKHPLKEDVRLKI